MTSNQSNDEVAALKARILDLEKRISDKTYDDQFRVFVDSALNGVIITDEEGRIEMTNQPAEEMFGYTKEEFFERRVEDLIPKRLRGGHSHHRASYHRRPEVRAMGAGLDLRAQRKDGTEFPVEIGLTPIPFNDKTMTLSVIVDISERLRINDTLRLQSEILKNVHDAVFLLNSKGEILDWNEGCERIFGIPQEQALNHRFFDFFAGETTQSLRDRLLSNIERQGSAEEVYFCKLNNGHELSILTKGTVINLGDETGFVICASDITKQKRLEAKIVSISENEQRRIGQDLHDDLCSQLSGIACITTALEAQFKKHRTEDAEMLAKVSDMVSDAVSKARQIARGLVPTALDTQGLDGALRDLVNRNCEIFGVNCRISRCDEEAVVGLPISTSTQIYRIAQEAITNAVKHSEADLIEISLIGTDDGHIILRIEDDGKGMPDDLVSAGLGLLTMRQRAEIIGANFDILANPKQGTSIVCTASKHKTIHE